MRIVYSILFIALIFSCKSDPTSGLQELKLLEYGLPISILAPEGAEVVADDLGFWTDVSIQKGEEYYIQIIGSNSNTFDQVKLKNEQLSLVKQGEFFSKIIQEDENGFLFEKKIGEKINYDFRLIKIQGDKEYIFQTGLYGNFSEEAVRKMYAACQ